MKKIIKIFIVASLFCLGTLRFGIDDNIFATTDYTNQVVVDDFSVLDSSGNPLTATNGAIHGGRYQYNISWTLPVAGNVLKEGDTLTLPVPVNEERGYWSVINSAYVDFHGVTGEVLGQWRIYGGKVEVVLGENANNLSSISANFLTGSGALTSYNFIPMDLVQNVSVGNVTKSIKFNASSLNSLTKNESSKASGSTSNSQISWGIGVNYIGIHELSSDEWGTNFTIKNNVYVEDIIEEGASIESYDFNTRAYCPKDLTSFEPAGNCSKSYSLNSYFTEVYQNPNESYASFKARLNTFEFGIYVDSNVETFIINMGNIGDNGLKYSDLDADFVKNSATTAINTGFYTESDRVLLEEYFSKVYGNSNIINGNLPNYSVNFRIEYNKVINDTLKTNTASVTINNETKNYSAGAMLQGNIGTASVASSAAGLYLYDEETGILLEGGTFKVQYNNNGTWEDYTNAGILTTDEEGFLQTPTLGAGTYRFVQLSASNDIYNLLMSQGYNDLVGTVVSEEFVINPLESEGELVEVSNIKHRYDVVYTSGEHGIFEDDEHLEIVVNSETPNYEGELCDKGNPIGEEGYDFVGWDKEISPLVTSSVVYVAQWEVATVEEPGEEPGSENNPEQVGTSTTPDGGLETNPFGMLAVLMVGGISLIFRIKK